MILLPLPAVLLALALGWLARGADLAAAPANHLYYLPLVARYPPTGVISATLTQGGMEREYILYVPSSYDFRIPAPLILNFHAYARDALAQMVYGDFRAVAEQTGAIVAHPQGAALDGVRRWNVGGIYTHPTADDVGFTGALIDQISLTYNVDPDRIYAAGFSNGAYMSYLLACQLSERIAAVAVVSGSMTPEMWADCQPGRPLPVLHIHGTADSVVPYAGDASSIAVDQVIAYWVASNKSITPAVIQPLPDIDPADGSTVTRVTYQAGDGGVPTEMLLVTGGGHTWPGSAVYLPGTNYDIDASALIWDFFARYDINGRIVASSK
jgi:polyhydroxybutyrate depolymerase